MATVELTLENFSTEVENSSMAIIDFWAPWCEPCKTFSPIFEGVSEDYPDVLFGKVNVDEYQAIAAHFNIQSIPTLLIIRDNATLFCEPGALFKADLNLLVKKSLEFDMTEVHAEMAKQQKAG